MNKEFKKGFFQGIGFSIGGGVVLLAALGLGAIGFNTVKTIPCRIIRSGYKLRPRSESMIQQCKKGSGTCVTKFDQVKKAWQQLTAQDWEYYGQKSNPFKKCGINRWTDSETRY